MQRVISVWLGTDHDIVYRMIYMCI